jgi:ABC-type branched-subunit amino acid transport system ATPase component
MALLDIRGATKRFGGLAAVAGVDLTVNAGEILSIIGPNGAGKTTLFELIAGNQRPDEGEILFDGKSLVGLRPHEVAKRGIARTFQAGRAFAQLTVAENVLIGAHNQTRYGFAAALLGLPKVRREEEAARGWVDTLLAVFGSRLTPRAEDQVMTLSYANRRRTEIARALASRPRLLLLDEPAAGMNPSEKRQIGDLIREIRDRGLTILLIEHHMRTVMEISDRIIVLDHGVKIADGTAAEVRDEPAVIAAYLGNPRERRRRATE